jgi:HD-GYP domain-containing protein (c-di-GMP phosphodiesterase class II)
MNRIDKAVLSSISRSDLMVRVTDFTASLYPENGLILLLKNEAAGCFDIMYEKHGPRGSAGPDSYPSISFDHIPEDIRSRMKTQEVIRVGDEMMNGMIRRGLPKDSRWVLNIPVTVKEDYYGSLIVSSDLEDGFSSDDIDVLEKLTDQIGVALQSVLQLEEKESLLLGALKALSAAIDAKSRWTAGHSERVQHLATALGMAAGLDENQLDCLSIASLLHDIGKLGIKEEILDKPGRLSEEEYAVIKTHPETGAQIFAHIPQYPEVTEGILRHHERWDGKGYPGRLMGKDIPLIGQIICIADVYDAVSADRPYRKGMAPEEITVFFQEERGRMFSPRLCDLFLSEVLTVPENQV